jgi:hypothetical protein
MTRLASRPRHSVEAFSFALALRRSDAPSFPAALDCRGIGRLLRRAGPIRVLVDIRHDLGEVGDETRDGLVDSSYGVAGN